MNTMRQIRLDPGSTWKRRLSMHVPRKTAARCSDYETDGTRARCRPSRSWSLRLAHGIPLALAVCVVIGFATGTLAGHTDKGEVKITQLSRREIIEELDGHSASVTVNEVSFEPGQEDSSHRHAGPVFGYVLEGEYEHAINSEPARTYRAGETFYEPSGSLHRLARNPSDKTRTRLLAVILHPREAKEVTTPQKGKE